MMTQALRILVRERLFSLCVVLVLGLGIGAVAVMFAIVDVTLIRSLPFPDADRLVVIEGSAAPPGRTRDQWWAQHSDSLEAVCTYSIGQVNVAGSSHTDLASATIVSPDFFSVFKVAPLVGRELSADSAPATARPTAVLSHAFALTKFGSSDSAIGQALNLNGIAHTVVGVMPPGFTFPGGTAIWALRQPDAGSLNVISPAMEVMVGRLSRGITRSQAQLEFTALLNRLNDTYAHTNLRFGKGVGVSELQESLVRNSRLSLLALFGASLFFLLLVCTNTAGLLVARTVSKHRDLAIRACLGASRLHIAGRLLAESVVLALLGGALGILTAISSLNVVHSASSLDIPPLFEIVFDQRVFGFAIVVSLLIGLLVGLAPALSRFSKQDLVASLKQDRYTGSARQGFRKVLIAGQLALALALTAATGLMIRTLDNLNRIAPGFDADEVLTLTVALPKEHYGITKIQEADKTRAPGGNASEGSDTAKLRNRQVSSTTNYSVAAFQRRVLDKIGRISGINAAGWVDPLPFASDGTYLSLTRPAEVPRHGMAACFNVAGNYFATMHIPILAGRSFTKDDNETAAPAIVINALLAERLWPDENPIGESIELAGELRQIIGIVGDVRHEGLDQSPWPQVYLDWRQPYRKRVALEMALVVRSPDDSAEIISSLRDQVMAADEDAVVLDGGPMEEFIYASTAAPRSLLRLIGTFSFLSMGVAALGVYALVAYSVTRRVEEFGIRMALGAGRRDTLALVMKETMTVAGIGLGAGLLIAVGMNRFLSSFLFGVDPADPMTLAGSLLVLAFVVLLAGGIPAVRASLTDPVVTLKYE